MICYMAAILLLVACHKEENDIFATASITLECSQQINVSRVQAQAKITNVNTRQTTTSAAFSGATLNVELLRGAYEILIEGVMTYTDAAGTEHIRQFRAQTDYVELAGYDTNNAKLNIIFLD